MPVTVGWPDRPRPDGPTTTTLPTGPPLLSRGAMRVLLVEDGGIAAGLIARALEAPIAAGTIELTRVRGIGPAAGRLSAAGFDCVLVDLPSPDRRGLDSVKAVHAADPDVAVVVLTGAEGASIDEAAMRSGAQDFLGSDELETRTLLRAMRYGVERQRQQVLLRAQGIEVLKSRARFQRAFDAAPVGMALVGLDRRFLEVNAALTEMLDCSAAHLGRLRVVDIVHEDNAPAFDASLARLVDGTLPSLRMECRLRSEAHDVWALVAATKVDEIGGGEAHVLVQAQDVTALKRLEAGLVHQTLHDPLTGLLNRVALRDRLERSLARLDRNGGAVAVFSLDLDGFKAVNDAFGRDRGDEVLVAVGRWLTTACRPMDTVARVGGDEFVVLADGVAGIDGAVVLGERMRTATTFGLRATCPEVDVSPSIGLSLTADPRRRADHLLQAADIAVGRAKERGGGCIEVFGARRHVAGRSGVEPAGGRPIGSSHSP